MTDETIAQKLQRLAREALPHPRNAETKDKNSKRRCVCGEFLPTYPKTRQKQKVCDDCADVILRMVGGKRRTLVCAGCGASCPRVRMKIKRGKLYCKKCLKLKYNIDF